MPNSRLSDDDIKLYGALEVSLEAMRRELMDFKQESRSHHTEQKQAIKELADKHVTIREYESDRLQLSDEIDRIRKIVYGVAGSVIITVVGVVINNIST